MNKLVLLWSKLYTTNLNILYYTGNWLRDTASGKYYIGPAAS